MFSRQSLAFHPTPHLQAKIHEVKVRRAVQSLVAVQTFACIDDESGVSAALTSVFVGMIERRTTEDKLILFGGMVASLVAMYFIYSYFRG